jgi:hypothetical protein
MGTLVFKAVVKRACYFALGYLIVSVLNDAVLQHNLEMAKKAAAGAVKDLIKKGEYARVHGVFKRSAKA